MYVFTISGVTFQKKISCSCLHSYELMPDLINTETEELVENTSHNVSILTYPSCGFAVTTFSDINPL